MDAAVIHDLSWSLEYHATEPEPHSGVVRHESLSDDCFVDIAHTSPAEHWAGAS